MSNYIPTAPDGWSPTSDTAKQLEKFISNFYRVSDDPDKDNEWVDFFAEDATVVMGSEKETATGRDGENPITTCVHLVLKRRRLTQDVPTPEILQLRKKMWESVKSRKHTVTKVFPGMFDGVVDFMLFGSVAYVLESGERSGVNWAARGELILEEDSDGESRYRFAYYRVYLAGA